MRMFCENINPKEADLEIRAEKMSRSLTIIYALQSSLDFEQGERLRESFPTIRICKRANINRS